MRRSSQMAQGTTKRGQASSSSYGESPTDSGHAAGQRTEDEPTERVLKIMRFEAAPATSRDSESEEESNYETTADG